MPRLPRDDKKHHTKRKKSSPASKFSAKSTAPLLFLIFVNALLLLSSFKKNSLVPSLSFALLQSYIVTDSDSRNLSSESTNATTLLSTSNSSSPTPSKPGKPAVAEVAYLLSVTGCVPKFRRTLFDAASVLKRSVERNSYPLHPEAKYVPKFYAIFSNAGDQHPECVKHMKMAGYTVKIFDLPVLPEQIDNETHGSFLRDSIARDGCCGHLELLKLHAWSMTDYPVAVHLDFDTLLLHPLDELLDAIFYPPHTPEGMRARDHLQREHIIAPTYRPTTPIKDMTIDAFYTKDYNMIPPGREHAIGIQGGFFVVRPNTTKREELANMVKTGHFIGGFSGSGTGWFGTGYGKHIWGSMTIQGLLAYYFDQVTHDTSIELHRCKFNSIADNPRRSSFDPRGKYPRGTSVNASADWHDTTCRDGRENCDDVQCQTWPVEDTRLFHYTYCKVPWNCRTIHPTNYFLYDETCKHMIHQWFEVRKTVPGQGVESTAANGQHQSELYLGYCRNENEYIFINQ